MWLSAHTQLPSLATNQKSTFFPENKAGNNTPVWCCSQEEWLLNEQDWRSGKPGCSEGEGKSLWGKGEKVSGPQGKVQKVETRSFPALLGSEQ